ncbi:MAG: molecular chaperone TorD family protein, partial [Desulfuromonadales bacterium]|nr:molecular chaperone TorD family protein [Desulfuromonadales bacterium]
MNDILPRTHLRQIARADIYRLLSAFFHQPEAAFVEEEVFWQLKTSMTKVHPQIVPDILTLEAAFKGVGLEVLQLDYSRLFLGPFEILAKPYGSVYLDGDKVVMGDSTVNAIAFYRAGEFDIAEDFREMPDHIAVELEFLYLLTFQIAQTSEEADRHELIRLKKKFLIEHLGQWVAPFAEAIRQGGETDFYRQLAQMTQQIV